MTDAVAPPASPARVHFHVALALILFPVFSLPATLVLVIVDLLRRAPTVEHRRWTRALTALFLVDLALAPVVVVLMMNRDMEGRPLSGPVGIVRPPARIGILFETGSPEAEPRVSEAMPGWPAERAGIRAGDRITAVDDRAVRTIEETRREIESSRPGVARRISIDRGGEVLRLDVVPWTPAPEGKDPLFHPTPGTFRLKGLFRDPGWWVAATLLALGAWGWSRRRPEPRVRVWRGMLAAFALTMAGVLATAWLLHRLQGGWSAGALLVTLLAQTLFMLGGAWIGSKLCGRVEPLPPDPRRLSTLKTVLLGLLYHVTGLARVSMAVLAVDRFLLGGAGAPGESALQHLQEMSRSPLGVLLFAVPVALVGPLAEETLFRGFLLPRLVQAVGVPLALAVSSAFFGVIHTHLGMYVVVVAYLGWVFGWARLRSGGLAAPVILHVLHNGIVTAAAFLR